MRGCPKCNGDGCEYCEYSGLDIKFARENPPKEKCLACCGVGRVFSREAKRQIECPNCHGTGEMK